MLIEQIIEFQSRGPGPPDCTCTPTTGYFHDKTKISRKIFEWIIIYCQIILQEATHLTSPYLGQITHLQNLTPKYKILNVLWT